MNRKLFLLVLLALLLTPAAVSGRRTSGKPLTLADPYILEYEGRYYAYGTSARDGIAVYVSDDLKHWAGPCGVAPGGLALHRDDSWGRHSFWAPEVYRLGGRFVMTYSVEEHIAVAFADSPLGPFRQEEMRPYIPEKKGIDSHVFVDDDGRVYLYWVRWDYGNGNEIHVAPLSGDLKQLDTARHAACIVTRPGTWEAVPDGGRVAEGPFVLKHGGKYYLTFSCNDFRSPDYAVGYAVSDSPMGPWTRYAGNPVLHRHGGYPGTGHHSFLRTSKGKMYIVFHAHWSAEEVGPRRTLLSPCRFVRVRGGADKIKVGTKIIVPTVD